MSESPAPYDGGDEPPVLGRCTCNNDRHTNLSGGVCWTCHCDERPTARVVAGYLTVEEAEKIARELAIEKLVERAETAERALLKTWAMPPPRRYAPPGPCRVCGGQAFRYHMDDPRALNPPINHAPDCVIPPLLERYGEG